MSIVNCANQSYIEIRRIKAILCIAYCVLLRNFDAIILVGCILTWLPDSSSIPMFNAKFGWLLLVICKKKSVINPVLLNVSEFFLLSVRYKSVNPESRAFQSLGDPLINKLS